MISLEALILGIGVFGGWCWVKTWNRIDSLQRAVHKRDRLLDAYSADFHRMQKVVRLEENNRLPEPRPRIAELIQERRASL